MPSFRAPAFRLVTIPCLAAMVLATAPLVTIPAAATPLTASASPVGRPGPAPRVAVMDFRITPGVPVGVGDAVAENLRTALIGQNRFVVLERAAVQQVLHEQRFGQSGLVDESQAVDLGKLLGARYIVVGSVTLLGSQYTVNARIVDVESGAAIGAQSLKAANPDDLATVVDRLASDLGRADGTRAAQPVAPASVPLAATTGTIQLLKALPDGSGYTRAAAGDEAPFYRLGDGGEVVRGIDAGYRLLPGLDAALSARPAAIGHLDAFRQHGQAATGWSQFGWAAVLLIPAVSLGLGFSTGMAVRNEPVATQSAWLVGIAGLLAGYLLGWPPMVQAEAFEREQAFRALGRAVDTVNGGH